MPAFSAWKDAYSDTLDAVLVAASKTSNFESPAVEYLGGRNVKYRKLSFGSGLQTYNRFSSADDDYTYTYETKTLANDQEKVFYLDWSDANDFPVNDATEIVSEFIRTMVVPAKDANFITKVVAAVPVGNTNTTAPTAANIKDQIDAAIAQLADVGVDSGTIYMDAATKVMFDSTLDRTYVNETGITNRVTNYNGWNIVQVSAAVAGSVNYLFVGNGCTQAITKHVYNQAFAPGQHTNGDGWLLQYRIIYDAVVLDNKAAGLYVNAA
jgi:hypothetical protein